MRLSELMSVDALTIPSDLEPAAALERMDEHGVRHLLVVDDEALVGVVSDRDLLDRPDGPVRGVMDAWPVVVRPDQTTASLSEEAVRRAGGCFPVVRDGLLLGVVTELDLLRDFVRACGESAPMSLLDPSVDELMTRDVVTVEASDRLADAEAVLATITARHAPVLQEGELVGLVSDRDLRRARGGGRDAATPVHAIMTRDFRVCRPSDAVSRAASRMIENRIGALPIVDDELVGILSSSDVILHWLGR